jgi:hypothetical protein
MSPPCQRAVDSQNNIRSLALPLMQHTHIMRPTIHTMLCSRPATSQADADYSKLHKTSPGSQLL